MRFRLHDQNLHVHGCEVHDHICDFFDHAPSWLVGNRVAARSQLLAYRLSVTTRLEALSNVLVAIDWMLARLGQIKTAA